MGNRACRTEQNGRSVTWSFDGIYRLTGETITGDSQKENGSVGYTLDPVGNRLTETSSLQGINSGTFSYNADDELGGETYDADGNVTATGGKTFTYDSQNELVSMNGGQVSIQYDGNGNRVAETASGATTRYLVDDLNPTGYAQVVEETVNGAPQREYTYGLERIDEYQIVNSAWTASYYGYDGFGTVRQLTNASGAVTDTWEYDAYGNVLNRTGSTPNEMLYRGEQYDSTLGLYYLRARYYNPLTGSFVSRDPNAGNIAVPASLHRYLYADGDPVDLFDPTGRDAETETGLTFALLDTRPLPAITELVGGAWTSTAATAISYYTTAMDYATSATAAVSDYLQALDWAGIRSDLSKVFFCAALELDLGRLLDKLAGDGASDSLPKEVTDKFEEVCLGYAAYLAGR